MSLRQLLASCSLLLAAACGDDARPNPQTPDPDAPPATPDAPEVCTIEEGYPTAVRPVDINLIAPTTLTLDGTGARCDQLIRALVHPTNRPQELVGLDAEDVTGTCQFDDVLQRDIVRLRAPKLAGLPLFAPIQDVLAHVDQTNTIQFLAGQFVPAPKAAPASCLDGGEAAGKVTGTSVTYGRFQGCQFQGEATYAIAADDLLEPGDEGWLLDAAGLLRRVREVDLYLLPANVTQDIINSDAYCCQPGTLDHCVGYTVFVDAFTGELVTQASRCHIC